MSEYRFAYNHTVPSGRVVLRGYNRGRKDHDVVLVSLPEDFPPLDAQLRGNTRRSAATVATMGRLAPGERGVFAVDLAPGRYGLVCFVPDSEGRAHAVVGMNSEFRARQPASPESLPGRSRPSNKSAARLR